MQLTILEEEEVVTIVDDSIGVVVSVQDGVVGLRGAVVAGN
jgi:hypothetical protein